MKRENKPVASSAIEDWLDYHDATLWGRPGFLARRFHQIHVAIFLETFSNLGVTPIQWGIMTVARAQPGLGNGEIALAVGIDRTNAADVCVRLEEKGMLVLSSSKEDKRKKCIFVTRKGTSLLKQNEGLVRESQDRLLEPLNSAERKVFLESLRRIVEHNNENSRAPLRFLDEI
jgi:MarR family transcriptional regulator, lower aerobic nicotinate degradation pathway regulator